jgi:hypothetical protein
VAPRFQFGAGGFWNAAFDFNIAAFKGKLGEPGRLESGLNIHFVVCNI